MIDPYPEDCIEAGYSTVCDECAKNLSEADALPTLLIRSWLILGVLLSGAVAFAGTYWIVRCMVDAAIAIGWPV
jgi:hypothetical protein